MSLIKDKVLYSKEPFVETLPDLGSHQNFGDYVLSFLDDPTIKDQVWLVNAGYDLTKCNSATCGGVSRTFGELELMSRSIGKQLDELGLEQGSIVQMLVPNNTDFHSVVIGTWLCRGVVSLSDPSLGTSLFIQQLHDTKSKIVICCPQTEVQLNKAIEIEGNLEIIERVALGETKMTAVKLRQSRGSLQNDHKSNGNHINGVTLNGTDTYGADKNGVDKNGVDKPFNLDETLIVFWSSGTTGRPKGIMHAGKYLASVLLSGGWTLQLSDVIMTTCFFHIGGFLAPLMNLVKKPTKTLFFFNGVDLDNRIELLYLACDKYKRNNGLICGSHHLGKLACTEPPLGPYGQPLDLTRVIIAMPMGTTVPTTLFGELKIRFPNLMAVPNYYGLTEFGRAIANSMDMKKLGRVASGVAVKIVEPETGEILGPNKVGEIMAKCDNVMKGYLNLPEETSAFFGKDGFVHTGDLARYDEDGVLYYEGRLKELIKYKNRHLYPLEIEKIIEEHPQVLEAGVFGLPDPSFNEHVCAAVVLAPDSDLTPEEICRFVEARVEDYKRLRGGVFFLDALPRNPQGKIQRNKLREIIVKS